MDKTELLKLFENIASGDISPEDAVGILKTEPFEDLGFAKPDHHSGLRQSAGEVIYGGGKTPEQILKIAQSLISGGQKRVLITRLNRESFDAIKEKINIQYYENARIGIIGGMPTEFTESVILIITAGTSDIPVAEEAALTAEFFGNRVKRIYDAGVAGIHRLLAHSEDIMKAKVIIAIAGMEGALASVVGGLADCPVIAVPTSVGYGASFGGISALLTMLNSCASGVTAVNIDNGFGAAYTANMINKL